MIGVSKSIAHIWELGGDIFEPKLLEIPITLKNLTSLTLVVVVDLSKVHTSLHYQYQCEIILFVASKRSSIVIKMDWYLTRGS